MSKMRLNKREFSKVITTCVVATLCALAVAFVVFLCYEMHRQEDLSPAQYIAPTIIAALYFVVKSYMVRANQKSQSDLEWEKTKQLTLWREKHPEHFTQGVVNTETNDEGASG